jgi:signal transduction histidine kinase
MHRGQIEVASAIGEGSAFTVRLPRNAEVAQGQ